MTSVLIVDDDSMALDALGYYVSQAIDLNVVGRLRSGKEAIDSVRDRTVDVILMDVDMPGMNGIDATRKIREFSETPIVLITPSDEDEKLLEAVWAGASGLILKDCSPTVLADSLRLAAAGGGVLSLGLSQCMLRYLPVPLRAQEDRVARHRLNQQEADILQLLCSALSNTQIAERVCLSQSTVKGYITSILAKLTCCSRLEAVVRAYELGLVRPPVPRG